MPLATRCPHCETVFRIQPEHLTLRGGLARCGHCQQVFDAANSLVDPDPALAPAIVEATPAQLADGNFTPGAWDMWAPWLDGGIDPKLRHHSGNTDTTPLVPIAAVPAGEVPASEAGLMRGAPAPGAVAAGSDETGMSGSHSQAGGTTNTAASTPLAPAHTASAADIAALVAALPRDAAEPSLGAAPPPIDTDTLEPQADDVRVHLAPRKATPPEAEPFAAEPEADGRVHFAMTRESPAAARGGFGRQVLGGFLAGLLLALLAGQLAWWLREPLLARWPAALGCTLEPPRAIDGLRLGASDLRQLDGPRVLELKVPLSNHANIALAWPSIELTLLDASNQVAARRVLSPLDYVRPGTPFGAGLPVGTTETLFVRIDTAPGAADGAPGLAASNFRIQIFYL
ncbi:MAG: DUF3426 domain-containing protein [Burkholderia sp.]